MCRDRQRTDDAAISQKEACTYTHIEYCCTVRCSAVAVQEQFSISRAHSWQIDILWRVQAACSGAGDVGVGKSMFSTYICVYIYVCRTVKQNAVTLP